jgi:hypothetical protein
MAAINESVSGKGRLGVVQCAVTGATVLGLFYVVCWLGAVLGMTDVSHMYLALFTTQPVTSVGALFVGLFWSLAFGLLAGGFTAFVYNAFGFLAPR